MRRQSEGAGTAGGSGRGERLDPFALPIRFAGRDAVADGQIRIVELHRERVVVRRRLRGIAITVGLPLRYYLGVSLRVGGAGVADHRLSICLEHRDPALCVPLLIGAQGSDVIAEWQLWARILGLPPLLASSDGGLREPWPRIGGVRVLALWPRRRRHHPIRARRPSMPLRRRVGVLGSQPKVYRGEREIIART